MPISQELMHFELIQSDNELLSHEPMNAEPVAVAKQHILKLKRVSIIVRCHLLHSLRRAIAPLFSSKLHRCSRTLQIIATSEGRRGRQRVTSRVGPPHLMPLAPLRDDDQPKSRDCRSSRVKRPTQAAFPTSRTLALVRLRALGPLVLHIRCPWSWSWLPPRRPPPASAHCRP